MINIGVIGCGQWGPNHIRIFSHLPDTKVLMCADVSAERLKAVQEAFPAVKVTADYNEILRDPNIHAVCIAAPTQMHFQMAREALEHNKHVLCEKPLALKVGECRQLKDLAARKQKILMVGHVFLFNAGILQLKQYIQSGELGRIYYAYATRTNLGPFRYDVSALWDLAPHDISIFNFLFDGVPVNVSARGQRYLGDRLEDLAFATLEYPGNVMANVHVSWLDPRKVRRITIVGDKKMVVWDDLKEDGPIRLYDKRVERTTTYYATYDEFKLLSQEGGVTIPKLNIVEPLKAQGQYFIDCITRNTIPDLADAGKGVNVVRVLEALEKSIAAKGGLVAL